jgi:hypothetical protein
MKPQHMKELMEKLLRMIISLMKLQMRPKKLPARKKRKLNCQRKAIKKQ